METIPVTLEKTLSIWWSAVWRMILLVAIAAVVLGGTVGLIVALMGKAELAGKVGEVLGPICALPVSSWAFKGALSKKGMAAIPLCS